MKLNPPYPRATPRRGSRLVPAGLALLAAVAAPPAAQAQFHPIEPGRSVQDTLTAADPTPSSRGPFRVYQFRARQGDRLTATLRSTDFDAYLRVGRDVGGITDELASDDDDGGDGGARVRFTVPEDGVYLLIAQSLEEDGSGAFTLALEPTPLPTTDAPHPIRVGQTANAELAETDAVQEDDGSYYDTWVIDAHQGERLTVRVESGAFDAFVSLGAPDAGARFEAIASNDDGDQPEDTTNARLRVRVPEAGTYQIRVSSIGVALGPYRLTVEEGPQPPARPGRKPIEIGDEVEGRLDENDAVLDDESYHELWTLRARAGDRLRVRMASTDFDTFVAFGRMVRDVFQEILANDDRPDGTDSELEVTVPRDGEYAIRASSLGPGLAGSYRLSVTRSR